MLHCQRATTQSFGEDLGRRANYSTTAKTSLQLLLYRDKKTTHRNICRSTYFHGVETEHPHLCAAACIPRITAVPGSSPLLDLCCVIGVTQLSPSSGFSCSVLAPGKGSTLCVHISISWTRAALGIVGSYMSYNMICDYVEPQHFIF